MKMTTNFYIGYQIFGHVEKVVQVSFAIRGGYVPEKPSTANTKTAI